MYELSLHQLLIRLGAAIIIVAVHGFALAAAARVLGDRGPQFDGRLTLNPLSHLDMFGGAALILFQLGWIRPIAIDHTALRFGRLGLVLCVLGSLAATIGVTMLLLETRLMVLNYLSDAIIPTVLAILNAAAEMRIWFAVFNLIPIPPLTGAHLLFAVAPALRKPAAKYRIPASIAWLVLIAVGVLQPALQPVRAAASRLLFSG